MTARADRGPQWDIGTQMQVSHRPCCTSDSRCSNRFMVDKGSDLYYNPMPLTGKEPRPESSDRGEHPDRPGQVSHTPQKPHPLDTRLQYPHAYQQQLGPMHGQMQSPNMPQHHPGMMGGYPGGSPYGVQQQVPPDQFYGGGPPMHLRPPQMGGVPQDHTMSPDIRRRVTRAMSDEYQGHGM